MKKIEPGALCIIIRAEDDRSVVGKVVTAINFVGYANNGLRISKYGDLWEVEGLEYWNCVREPCLMRIDGYDSTQDIEEQGLIHDH